MQPLLNAKMQRLVEQLDALRRVDDLDDDRQVLGHPEQARGVHHRIRAEPHDAAQHRSASQSLAARLLDELFRECAAVEAIALTNEHPH